MNFTAEIPEADLRAFEGEFKRYYQAVGKDAAYVSNRVALNVAIKSGQATPPADASAIRALPKKEWWPKLVAKRLSSSGVRLRGKSPKRYSGRREIQGKYTREEARQASKQMVRNRLRKRGYIRSGWLPAIQTLSALKLKLRGRLNQTPGFVRDPAKQPGSVTPATAGMAPVCEIVNSAVGADKVALRGLVRGFQEATLDMRQFLDERYGETARQFNAK